MSLGRLAWQNIIGSLFRSSVVFLCSALMAGFALASTLLIREAQARLHLSLQRLGADVILISRGINTDLIEGARLITTPSKSWLPWSALAAAAAVPGVEAVSPQLFLATIDGGACCSLPQLYLIAYDPESDFVLRPWLQGDFAGRLALGEAVAGAALQHNQGEGTIVAFGYPLLLHTRLAATGTDLDNALFVSFETAQAIADSSGGQLDIVPASMSSALVRVRLGSDPHEVAVRLMETVPSAISVESERFFQAERQQMVGLLRTVLGLLLAIWALALAVTGLVFTLAVNERRRHLAVLRALGADRSFLLRSLLLEGLFLGLGGGAFGVMASFVALALLPAGVSRSLGLALASPPPTTVLFLALMGLALAPTSVAMAAFWPAWRVSRSEPALAMRE
ncbi:MAG: FtsX-like permease family protein [Anaerolineae bacterium]